MAQVSCSSHPHPSRPTLGLRQNRTVHLGALVLVCSGIVLGIPGCTSPPDAAGWTPAPGLKTRWAADVDSTNPLPEYPRPQMVRPEWMSLNGLWDFALLPQAEPMPEQYPDKILVPFPVESALSGVSRTVGPQDRIWYRRTFSLPQVMEDSRWLLHFGAVDWEAEVFLNGGSLGTHRGGYDPFSFDITDRIVAGQDQELVVAVRDPTNEGNQPRGKQVLDPHGIWYTAVSGIWQTVWLEPVPESHIGSIRLTPSPDLQSVEVMVELEGSPGPAPVLVTILAGNRLAAEAEGVTGEALSISVPEPRPWSPDDPFLYGLRVRLMDGSSNGGDPAEGSENSTAGSENSTAGSGDEVESYFGMRSVAVGADENGHQRLLLNGEPLFQYGLLDQGWWPDGLYTAPTDEALRFDVEKTKELGFNLIRKHVKVEPARWYYHCDRAGILVWQDMPSANNEGVEAEEEFASELRAVVSSLRDHPSIVMWVPFNEGWGQHRTEEYVEWLKTSDPTRLVNNASGWTDTGAGDVLDIHRYPGPGAPTPDALSGIGPSPDALSGTGPSAAGRPTSGPRAAVLGEFGGLGLPLPGHTWVEEDNWGYRSYETLDELNPAYADLLTQLRPLIGEGLSAAVYTQTTDVEVEVNGIMTYDREVVKLNEAALEPHRKLFGPPPILRPLVATSMTRGQPWRFTTSDPGEGWAEPGLDDSGWAEGMGGFGTEGTPGSKVRTVWDTPEIWIRRTFSLPQENLEALANAPLYLRIHHDEDAEVYLNGTLIANLEGYSTGYLLIRLTPEGSSHFEIGGNILAAHVRQTGGGQYIDVGIVEWIEAGEG